MKSNKKRRSLFKRFLRFFLWIAAIFTVLVIAAIIVLRIQFPPEKIKKLIETELSSALNNRPVRIGSANLNILKGFVFEDLSIYDLQPVDLSEQKVDSTKFISIDKTYLNYSLLSLLRRNVKIRNIIIDHPVINYTSHQDKTNIDDLITHPITLSI